VLFHVHSNSRRSLIRSWGSTIAVCKEALRNGSQSFEIRIERQPVESGIHKFSSTLVWSARTIWRLYEHARKLGSPTLGRGPKGPTRFPLTLRRNSRLPRRHSLQEIQEYELNASCSLSNCLVVIRRPISRCPWIRLWRLQPQVTPLVAEIRHVPTLLSIRSFTYAW